MPIDIFESGFTMPETVYVLASGPNGVEHYKEIPDSAFIIAVNKAIEISGVNSAIWLCADGTLPGKDWFHKAAIELIACDYDLNDIFNPTPIFDAGVLLENYPDVPYYFHHGGDILEKPIDFKYGFLKGGATISSQAVQLAYLLGARHIILCGVDMLGKKYFDGSDVHNGQTKLSNRWHAERKFNILLNWLRKNGCIVESISPTALKIKGYINYRD